MSSDIRTAERYDRWSGIRSGLRAIIGQRETDPDRERKSGHQMAAPAVRGISSSSLTTRFTLLSLLLLLLSIIAAGVGGMAIPFGETLAILGSAIGLPLEGLSGVGGINERHADLLLAIRLPRIVLAILVGAGLGISGAAMQGLFRNPLADPGLIGVSGGAAFAAVGAIVLGGLLFGTEVGTQIGPLSMYATAFSAFIGGVAATFLAFRIGSRGGQVSVATLLLAGIAVNALAGAGTGFLTYIATDAQLRSITFWSLGSLGGADWTALAIVGPCTLVPILLLPRYADGLNGMLLGESEASYLGIDVERMKRRVVLLTALAVGASVAMTGVIGFVGLVIPHLLRLLFGPNHRFLLPASALLGAIFLVGADTLARTIVAPAEMPIGILTASVGAPFFLWLLVRGTRAGEVAGS